MSIFNDDLKGQDYRFLLEVATQKCNRFAFVLRRDMMLDETVVIKHFNKFIDDIQDSFIEMKLQSEWGTTKLLDSEAYVYYFRLNEKTKHFLQTKSISLFGWLAPNLPEDLMLYKDDQIWLASCSHERWFTCDLNVNSSDELINHLRAEYKA